MFSFTNNVPKPPLGDRGGLTHSSPALILISNKDSHSLVMPGCSEAFPPYYEMASR